MMEFLLGFVVGGVIIGGVAVRKTYTFMLGNIKKYLPK